jgi:FkbM family methyltransferase
MSDREQIALIKRTVKPGMTVLDIGANIGFYSTRFSKLVGEKGNVIAFEPDALNFRHLLANTRKLANVTVHQLACGDKAQRIKLYLSDRFNVDHQTFDSGEGRKSVEIQSISIDEYLKDNEKIDFIKIDVQGYDFYAIKGAIGTIRNSPSLIILGELWPYALNRAGVRPSEYIKLLESLGLSVEFPHNSKHENFDETVHDRYFYIDFCAVKKT